MPLTQYLRATTQAPFLATPGTTAVSRCGKMGTETYGSQLLHTLQDNPTALSAVCFIITRMLGGHKSDQKRGFRR